MEYLAGRIWRGFLGIGKKMEAKRLGSGFFCRYLFAHSSPAVSSPLSVDSCSNSYFQITVLAGQATFFKNSAHGAQALDKLRGDAAKIPRTVSGGELRNCAIIESLSMNL